MLNSSIAVDIGSFVVVLCRVVSRLFSANPSTKKDISLILTLYCISIYSKQILSCLNLKAIKLVKRV